MRVLGIIAEYDPFHSGHQYHLRESLTRAGAEASVVLMSGCFTQRGLPAMLEKRLRARAAVECGADLVIELPFVYAAGNAEMFARGGVGIMNGLGIVDFLSFGSESGDVDSLMEVASVFAENSQVLNESIREAMGQGVSYPAARERAAARLLKNGAATLMREPNNILAIEYLRELTVLGSGIRPLTIRRAVSGVREANGLAGIAGAAALRAMFEASDEHALRGAGATVTDRSGECAPGGLAAGEPAGSAPGDAEIGFDDPCAYLPEASARVIREHLEAGGRLVFADALFPHLVRSVVAEARGDSGVLPGAVRAESADVASGFTCPSAFALSEILSATEGLENRLVKAVRRATCMAEVVRYTKTRRYTETRVRRLILHTVMGLTKSAMREAVSEPFYARVLAFSKTGARLIRRVKEEGGVPVITNANRERDALAASPVTFGYDVRAAELHRLLERGNLAEFNEKSARPYAAL